MKWVLAVAFGVMVPSAVLGAPGEPESTAARTEATLHNTGSGKAGEEAPRTDELPVEEPTKRPLTVEVAPAAQVPWVVQVEQPGGEWWATPAGWSPIIALLIAAVGWLLAARHVGRQIDQQRDQQKEQFAIENAQKQAEIIREKLNKFYRPYKQLSDTNKLLHDLLKEGQPDPGNFRALFALLTKESLNENDKALLNEIVAVGASLEKLLAEESGYVDDPDLREVFARAARHFRVLRLASGNKITGDTKRFEGDVYPRELDGKLDARIAALEGELRLAEKFLAKKAPRTQS